MIKLLYLPLNAGDHPQTGMYDAFKELNYIDFHIFDYYNRFMQTKNLRLVCQEFIEKVEKTQPTWVHMQLQMTNIIDADTLKKARAKVKHPVIFTNWSGDVRNTAQPEMVAVSDAVDYTLISSTGQIGMYETAGCKNVRYWQIGYDPKLIFPKFKEHFLYDLCFVGNAYPFTTFADAKKRHDILLSLKQHFGERFAIFGSGYSNQFGKTRGLSGNEVNEAYNNSRCILSISNYNDISHYFSDRLLNCLAAGRPTISYRFPNYQSYFSDNSDILIANNVEDIINKVEFCKMNPEFANSVGICGYKKVLSEHSYKSRVVELINCLGIK